MLGRTASEERTGSPRTSRIRIAISYDGRRIHDRYGYEPTTTGACDRVSDQERCIAPRQIGLADDATERNSLRALSREQRRQSSRESRLATLACRLRGYRGRPADRISACSTDPVPLKGTAIAGTAETPANMFYLCSY